MKLRIKFRKFGPIRFIGHLDVMRFFQKAIRRAEIDVAYTAGYSPHQIMSFAAPLSVGLTSDGEYMDIEVHSITSCEDVKAKLNQVTVPGIEIVNVTILPETAKNAMASVAAAAYTVHFRPGTEPECNFMQAIPDFLSKEEIFIIKEGKKGARQIDIRPGIYRLEYLEEHNALRMLVDASSSGNIKPAQVIEALLAQNGVQLPQHALLVNRDDTFSNSGTEETPKFVPLDCV